MKDTVSEKSDFNPIYVCCQPSTLGLPLRKGDVTFAVRTEDGRMSDLWKVKVSCEEIYILSRDSESQLKISLHKSGQQHIKIKDSKGPEWKWIRSSLDSPVQPSVKLLFPVWSLGVGPTRKKLEPEELQRMLDGTQIFIKGEDGENHFISVYFFLTRPNVSSHTSMPEFAILPVGQGNKEELHIVAFREFRPNFRKRTEEMLNKNINTEAWPIGKKSSLLFSGEDADDQRPYAMRVLVEMTSRGLRLVQGDCVYAGKT